jgi:universal stress protein F
MYKHILVPVSFDNDRDAAGAMDVAKLLGEGEAKITLLHVFEQIPAYVVSYMPEDYLAESQKAVAAELAAMAKKLPKGEAAVITGHSGRTILDWAADHDVDLIVIASHRPGMQDLLLGSTAAQVVRHAPCAVHVVR